MSIVSVEITRPQAYAECYLGEAIKITGKFTEDPGTPHPVTFAGAAVPPSISFGVIADAQPEVPTDFEFPSVSAGVGFHQVKLYATNGVDYVESEEITVRVRFRKSEGQYVVYRDTHGYREYLTSTGAWTQLESEAWKIGTEAGALDQAAAWSGSVVQPAYRAFRGPVVA